MRCLLKPARIQLSTICRGFGRWTDCMLRAALFIASTTFLSPPGIGSSRRTDMPSADLSPSPGSERKLIPTLNLFQNQRLGLFCGPLGSIYCGTRIAQRRVPWSTSLVGETAGINRIIGCTGTISPTGYGSVPQASTRPTAWHCQENHPDIGDR